MPWQSCTPGNPLSASDRPAPLRCTVSAGLLGLDQFCDDLPSEVAEDQDPAPRHDPGDVVPLSLGPLDWKWRQARQSPLSLDVLEQMCVEGVDMIKGTPDDDERQAEDEQHGQTER